jgi:hypothetical protein
VFIDRRDFIPGSDIEAEIVRCICRAGTVALHLLKKFGTLFFDAAIAVTSGSPSWRSDLTLRAVHDGPA